MKLAALKLCSPMKSWWIRANSAFLCETKTGRPSLLGAPRSVFLGLIIVLRFNGDRDRGHPNRDRNASGGRLRPTSDGAHSSSVRVLRAIHDAHDPLAGCSSRDVPRLRGVCGPP